MTNSADPDQLASSEANWSGSHCLQRQGISRFSRTRVKGNGYSIRGGNVRVVFASLLKKRFLLEQTSFQKGLDMQECKQEVTKVNKFTENLPSVSSLINPYPAELGYILTLQIV